jgi:hypothetical protein
MEPNGKPGNGYEYLLPAGCTDIGAATWVLKIKKKSPGSPQARRLPKKRAKEKPVVYLSAQLSVRELAAALGAKLSHIIKLLKQMQAFTGANQKIPFYTAARVAKKYGFTAKKKIKAF